jgi:hypothetical protein
MTVQVTLTALLVLNLAVMLAQPAVTWLFVSAGHPSADVSLRASLSNAQLALADGDVSAANVHLESARWALERMDPDGWSSHELADLEVSGEGDRPHVAAVASSLD